MFELGVIGIAAGVAYARAWEAMVCLMHSILRGGFSFDAIFVASLVCVRTRDLPQPMSPHRLTQLSPGTATSILIGQKGRAAVNSRLRGGGGQTNVEHSGVDDDSPLARALRKVMQPVEDLSDLLEGGCFSLCMASAVPDCVEIAFHQGEDRTAFRAATAISPWPDKEGRYKLRIDNSNEVLNASLGGLRSTALPVGAPLKVNGLNAKVGKQFDYAAGQRLLVLHKGKLQDATVLRRVRSYTYRVELTTAKTRAKLDLNSLNHCRQHCSSAAQYEALRVRLDLGHCAKYRVVPARLLSCRVCSPTLRQFHPRLALAPRSYTAPGWSRTSRWSKTRSQATSST